MSILNQFHTNDPNVAREWMYAGGPLITVEVSIPQPLAKLYADSSLPVPSPQSGLALIDTGASHTCFDDGLVQSLGVSPTDIAEVFTPSGGDKQNTYPIHLRVPTHNIDVELQKILGANLSRQKTPDGQPIIGLLGRDFLANFIFIYNGVGGIWSLAN